MTSTALAAIALETLNGTIIRLDGNGIKVERLLSAHTYPWGEVTKVAAVPAPGSLADESAGELGAVGIGLFLHTSRKPRLDHLDADAIIEAAPNSRTDLILRAIEIIQAYRQRVAGRANVRAKLTGPANPAQGQFRRPRAAGGAIGEPAVARRAS